MPQRVVRPSSSVLHTLVSHFGRFTLQTVGLALFPPVSPRVVAQRLPVRREWIVLVSICLNGLFGGRPRQPPLQRQAADIAP
jgi:hypothetical protein